MSNVRSFWEISEEERKYKEEERRSNGTPDCQNSWTKESCERYNKERSGKKE